MIKSKYLLNDVPVTMWCTEGRIGVIKKLKIDYAECSQLNVPREKIKAIEEGWAPILV